MLVLLAATLLGFDDDPAQDLNKMEGTWIAGPIVHRVQICVSRDPSDNPDVRISGTAWVDDVNLVPQPAEHHKP